MLLAIGTMKVKVQNNEWVVEGNGKVVELPEGFEVLEDTDADFATTPESYAERVTAVRLLMTAVDGKCSPKRFKSFAEALTAAREEFGNGMGVAEDGVRRFDGIQVRLGVGLRSWHNVNVKLSE